jgi:outer membrane murein-binding lipoprotein Lpp
MPEPKIKRNALSARLALVVVAALLLSGCGLFRTKRKITVPQLLSPLATATVDQLLADVNQQASVRSLNGRIDIQFLDTSFAACGLADLYRTADGRVVAQRPGQVYLSVQVPVIGTKVAELSSDGQKFWAAVYQGDPKYRRFVTGTNTAQYERLEDDGTAPDCRENGQRREQAMQRATVSALSSLRPQHFTDALLLPPVQSEGSGLLYAVSETFEEESDPRPNARRDSRVVRGYYVVAELEPGGPARARVRRRFWFDRVGAVRLARVQTYGERGQLVTDVVYGPRQPFGENGQYRLPAQIELTRPQDSYSIRLTFQDPASVEVNVDKDADIFVLKNESSLPVVDLDAVRR